jgi:glc operon protein GlcG
VNLRRRSRHSVQAKTVTSTKLGWTWSDEIDGFRFFTSVGRARFLARHPRRQVLKICANPENMNTYGLSISLENAKKVVALALAEARKNNWTMAAAIVDGGGNLVYFEKMDNTQIGSINISIEKARSAALFKRSTKAFQDALATGGGGLVVLGVPGAVPLEGGIPLLLGDNIVGAIGVSGETPEQDGQCAKVGADGLK